MTIRKSVLQLLALAILTCTISACDGGLFGTGDGLPVVTDNSDVSEAGGDVTMAPGADTTPTPNTPTSFDNLQVGTTTTTPLINVINVSDQAIITLLSDDTNPLFTGPIAAGTFTQTATLQLGENNLTIIDAQNADELLSISPLNVGVSSLTTLIVRSNAMRELDVVALSSSSISLTPTMAQLRVVQSILVSNTDVTATFSLQPSGDSPGAAEVNFPNISVASASSSNYQSVSPGDYLLVDSLDRINPEIVNLQAGKIYTLIIVNNPETRILLHEDDLLAR